ncbi:MAG: DUF424 domain-containing protein [Candidatus Micrarchaeia archaeon]
MVYFKKYETENGTLLAVCDEELIGRKLSEGNRQMDLDTYAEFYVGEKLEEGAVAKALDSVRIYSANVVGKKSVGIFLKKGIVKKENVMEIEGVPYVQIFSLK